MLRLSEKERSVINIVCHARGGHGAVTACEIIAEAAYLSGKFKDVHAYPNFGAERRGAPIVAYAKLSKTAKIWDRAQITKPDILLIFDETVLNQVIASSLREGGMFIVNTDKEPAYFVEKYNLSSKIKVIAADISKLSLEKDLLIDGIPVVNTPILGLLAKAVPELAIDDLKIVIEKRMSENLAKVNIELMEQGFELAKTV